MKLRAIVKDPATKSRVLRRLVPSEDDGNGVEGQRELDSP
jgi:hypothetical protein